MATNALASLKGIQLPAAVSIWPLAPGWYLLIACILILIIFLSVLVFRKQKKSRAKQKVIHLFNQIVMVDDKQDQNLIPGRVSTFLKQVAITQCKGKLEQSDKVIKTLHGDAWLAFLDKMGKTTNFSEGAGQLLLTSYSKYNYTEDEINQLIYISRALLKRVL